MTDEAQNASPLQLLLTDVLGVFPLLSIREAAAQR